MSWENELRERRAYLMRQVEAINVLLNVDRGIEVTHEAFGTPGFVPEEHTDTPQIPPAPANPYKGLKIKEAILKLLEDEGRPMTSREITDSLVDLGFNGISVHSEVFSLKTAKRLVAHTVDDGRVHPRIYLTPAKTNGHKKKK
jgi:hypothetical protein